MEPEVVDDPENRVVRVPALLRREPEKRRELAVDPLDGHRGEGDEREGQVDREHRDRDELDRTRNRARRLARLFREIRDGLDPGVREHRDRDRDREVRPRRGDAPVDVVDEHLRAEHQHRPHQDEQHLRREVDDREDHGEPRGLLDADDVQRDERDDHDHAADDVPGVRPQRLPEDREVVGDEERGRRDRDDVDERLRPPRAERDELVERVPGEARRAARLRVAHGALGVARGGRGEDQPCDREDERREPERERGGDAERVVDRRADVPVRRREERGCAEHALHAHLTAPSRPGHRRSLVRVGEPHGSPTSPLLRRRARSPATWPPGRQSRPPAEWMPCCTGDRAVLASRNRMPMRPKGDYAGREARPGASMLWQPEEGGSAGETWFPPPY